MFWTCQTVLLVLRPALMHSVIISTLLVVIYQKYNYLTVFCKCTNSHHYNWGLWSQILCYLIWLPCQNICEVLFGVLNIKIYTVYHKIAYKYCAVILRPCGWAYWKLCLQFYCTLLAGEETCRAGVWTLTDTFWPLTSVIACLETSSSFPSSRIPGPLCGRGHISIIWSSKSLYFHSVSHRRAMCNIFKSPSSPAEPWMLRIRNQTPFNKQMWRV